MQIFSQAGADDQLLAWEDRQGATNVPEFSDSEEEDVEAIDANPEGRGGDQESSDEDAGRLFIEVDEDSSDGERARSHEQAGTSAVAAEEKETEELAAEEEEGWLASAGIGVLAPPRARKAAVWEDPDDADVAVDVAKVSRLRKLRHSQGEAVITGAARMFASGCNNELRSGHVYKQPYIHRLTD